MMSAAAIYQLQAEATAKAARANKKPYVLWPEDLAVAKTDPAAVCQLIPFLGEFVHPNWERVPDEDPFFVDSSGFGQEGEPALTIREFFSKLRAGDALGIVEAGQFQVYIARYQRRK
jgi:hypothetical protein